MAEYKDYSNQLEEAVNYFQAGDFNKSIELVKDMLSESPFHPQLMFTCSGLLIDAGNIISDISSIQLGTSLIEKLLPNINPDDFQTIGNLEYNLSNGYSSQAELFRNNGEDDLYVELIQKQKKFLQNVLLKGEKLDNDILCKAISNYGNLLFDLGRVSEAIDYLYDCLSIDPKHAVAMCNCSSALQKTINLSYKHNHRICYEFWRLMNDASKLPNEIVKRAGMEMYQNCVHSRKAIEEYSKNLHPEGIEGLKNQILAFEKAHTWQPNNNLLKVEKDRLFLTVNPRFSNCIEHYKDDLCFENMITPLDKEGEVVFQKIINVFNHIKEDFSTARYLYYESLKASEKLSEASSITYYIESYNSSDFGLKTGFLKTSFRLAADLLDKCAGFINLYLHLEHPEDKVTLNNVWYVKRTYKKGLHPTIKNLIGNNFYLFALKDLNGDLHLGNFPAPIRDLRNDATHKRLILSLYGSYQEYDETIDIEQFQTFTRLLLRMAKAATIYLIGLVNIEEKRRNKNLEDKIGPKISYKMNYGLSDQINLDQF